MRRVTLWFETAFWEARREFRDAGFFYSQERIFPTWWRAAPASVSVGELPLTLVTAKHDVESVKIWLEEQ